MTVSLRLAGVVGVVGVKIDAREEREAESPLLEP
jgi:hypothetical protein